MPRKAFTAAATLAVVAGLTLPSSETLVLTADNFTEVTGAPGAKVLVQFYAPWCSHSKKLAPHFARAAARLRRLREGDASLVGRLATVDATVETRIAARYGVKGYPALWWLAAGEATEYRGALMEDALFEWVIARDGPLVRLLANQTAAEAFRLSSEVTLVAKLRPPPDPAVVAALERVRAHPRCHVA